MDSCSSVCALGLDGGRLEAFGGSEGAVLFSVHICSVPLLGLHSWGQTVRQSEGTPLHGSPGPWEPCGKWGVGCWCPHLLRVSAARHPGAESFSRSSPQARAPRAPGALWPAALPGKAATPPSSVVLLHCHPLPSSRSPPWMGSRWQAEKPEAAQG